MRGRWDVKELLYTEKEVEMAFLKPMNHSLVNVQVVMRRSLSWRMDAAIVIPAVGVLVARSLLCIQFYRIS